MELGRVLTRLEVVRGKSEFFAQWVRDILLDWGSQNEPAQAAAAAFSSRYADLWDGDLSRWLSEDGHASRRMALCDAVEAADSMSDRIAQAQTAEIEDIYRLVVQLQEELFDEEARQSSNRPEVPEGTGGGTG